MDISGEIVYLSNGQSLFAKAHRVEGDSVIVIILQDGGEITAPRSLVAATVPATRRNYIVELITKGRMQEAMEIDTVYTAYVCAESLRSDYMKEMKCPECGEPAVSIKRLPRGITKGIENGGLLPSIDYSQQPVECTCKNGHSWEELIPSEIAARILGDCGGLNR